MLSTQMRIYVCFQVFLSARSLEFTRLKHLEARQASETFLLVLLRDFF